VYLPFYDWFGKAIVKPDGDVGDEGEEGKEDREGSEWSSAGRGLGRHRGQFSRVVG
jgi:hypothetical protein